MSWNKLWKRNTILQKIAASLLFTLPIISIRLPQLPGTYNILLFATAYIVTCTSLSVLLCLEETLFKRKYKI